MHGKGFTFIELIVVCVVVIISSLIIVPQLINFIGTTNLDVETKKLRSKIRQVQQLAITKQKTHRIEFDLVGEGYALKYDSGAGSFVLVETVNLKDNIGIESTTFTTPANDTVDFDYFGAPSQAGSIVLQDTKSGRASTISIAAATGKVGIE